MYSVHWCTLLSTRKTFPINWIWAILFGPVYAVLSSLWYSVHTEQLLFFCGYHRLPELAVLLYFFFPFFLFTTAKILIVSLTSKSLGKFSTFLGSCSTLVLACTRVLQSHALAVLISASLFKEQTTSNLPGQVKDWLVFFFLRKSSCAFNTGWFFCHVLWVERYCESASFSPLLSFKNVIEKRQNHLRGLTLSFALSGQHGSLISGWLFSFLGYWIQFIF